MITIHGITGLEALVEFVKTWIQHDPTSHELRSSEIAILQRSVLPRPEAHSAFPHAALLQALKP